MSDMIERVAEAIMSDLRERSGVIDGIDEDIVEEMGDTLARAAIEAMRAPTEAMEEAALDVRPLMLPDSPREVWGAMIDAALNEERQG